jgi:RHH-type rel operon transcriptional repressor/antitoxin RelB
MFQIDLPQDIQDRLDAIIKKTGKTQAFYIEEAIEKYMDDLEDQYLSGKDLNEARKKR